MKLNHSGKRLNIGKSDLMTIAKDNSIKRGESIVDEINEVVKSWKEFAEQAGVRDDLREHVYGNLNVV